MKEIYNKKKIFFIITDYGSFNNFLSELSIKLSQLDFEIHVITSIEKIININDKYDYKLHNINFHYFEFPRNFNFKKHYEISKKIHQKIHEIKPDLVSMHFTTGIFTTLLSGKLPYKTIGTFHGLGFPIIDNLIKKFIFKTVELFCASRLDEVWLLNKTDYDILKNYFPKKTYLLPTNGLGCDLEIFNRNNFSTEKKNTLKKSLNIENHDFVITFTGRYVNFKGYHIVIKTFKILEEKYKLTNLKLIIMGGKDKIHPTGLSDAEEEYVIRNEKIIDIGFTKNVADYLAITDLFFFPSKKEGVPICIVEALSMSVPVITFNARGCNDLIIDDFNGRTLDVIAGPEHFAKEIYNLYCNPQLLKKYMYNTFIDRKSLSRENFIDYQLNSIINTNNV